MLRATGECRQQVLSRIFLSSECVATHSNSNVYNVPYVRTGVQIVAQITQASILEYIKYEIHAEQHLKSHDTHTTHT